MTLCHTTRIKYSFFINIHYFKIDLLYPAIYFVAKEVRGEFGMMKYSRVIYYLIML